MHSSSELPGGDGTKMQNRSSKHTKLLQKMPNKPKQADACRFSTTQMSNCKNVMLLWNQP